MRMRLVASLLLCELSPLNRIQGQNVDPSLMSEAAVVRAELARSNVALRQYTWTEQTEAFVSSSLKSSRTVVCRYDDAGQLTKTPVGTAKEDKSRAVSRRPGARSNADMMDYIERAISRIHAYVPPKPERIDRLLQDGSASLGKSEAGKSEVRFTYYFEQGDSLTFTYDSVSKVLLRVSVTSTLGSPKDPVTLEAVFVTMPDGPTHLSSAILNAKRRSVQVKMQNTGYEKVATR